MSEEKKENGNPSKKNKRTYKPLPKTHIPATYFPAVMFASKLMNEDKLDMDKAVEIATGYYRKKFVFIEEAVTKEYLLTRLREQKILTLNDESEEAPEKRVYQYWIVQKSFKNKKGRLYSPAKVIKAMSKHNAEIQCKRKDWEQIGTHAENPGFYIEHRIMSGPYETREEAEAVIAMCH
jgi:hypothetical protein